MKAKAIGLGVLTFVILTQSIVLWEAHPRAAPALCCTDDGDCGDNRICCPAYCLGAYDCTADGAGYCRTREVCSANTNDDTGCRGEIMY